MRQKNYCIKLYWVLSKRLNETSLWLSLVIYIYRLSGLQIIIIIIMKKNVSIASIGLYKAIVYIRLRSHCAICCHCIWRHCQTVWRPWRIYVGNVWLLAPTQRSRRSNATSTKPEVCNIDHHVGHNATYSTTDAVPMFSQFYTATSLLDV